MGYWNSNKDGQSLQSEDTGLVWGDRPADSMDNALREILEAFTEDLGRPPTVGEVKAGLLFSLLNKPDDTPLTDVMD